MTQSEDYGLMEALSRRWKDYRLCNAALDVSNCYYRDRARC